MHFYNTKNIHYILYIFMRHRKFVKSKRSIITKIFKLKKIFIVLDTFFKIYLFKIFLIYFYLFKNFRIFG